MLQLITPIATVSSRRPRRNAPASLPRFSRNVSAGTSRSAATWRVDEFDACRPAYLLQRDDDGPYSRAACGFLPTTGPTMLRDTFPAAAWTDRLRRRPIRFGRAAASASISLPRREDGGAASRRATYELFAGMIEFGLMRQLTDIVTVTDARMERILCRARWPLRRLGSPRAIGKTIAVAGYLEVSRERLECVREAGDLAGRVTRIAGGDAHHASPSEAIGAAA